ncbi:hypothetical protein ACGFZA_22380 [Streptomyces sp. NPDC048211]|uniref:hypothetical protein n=1 Tax=Streptomyces sp. NPDC048211 TaxID=3365516 RepID=UPI00371EDE85
MTQAIHRPDWVPASGHQLRMSGVHFDALRVQGIRGEEVAARLGRLTGDDAGPVVWQGTGPRWMYFLLPPRTAGDRAWPLDVERYGTRFQVGFVGVPALNGHTWPLMWQSRPTPTAPFVDADRLYEALGAGRAAT